ncbi:MAG: heparinase II/III family protein [Cyclobacteriaceae bacterium]|nr:heparinase II/III family protein [Cyclobacteriaceae bacterium]
MYTSFKIRFLLVFTMMVFLPSLVLAQSDGFTAEAELLFSRLNLDVPAFQAMRTKQDSAKVSAKDLLHYYKNRTTVKHPIHFEEEEDIKPGDLQWANDALEHIFVGQPAYPSQFCGDDINWNSRPVPDNEWVWQLNRMYFWNAMGNVYAATGDERYAKEWCAQLTDWTRKNPRDEAHSYAWRSIEAGIRGHNWTGLFYRFLPSEHFTPEVLVAFMNSCYDHAEYLMTVYRTGSNWGLMEAEGLAFIAFTFPEFKDSEKWKTEAVRRLNKEINLQVYPDGHQQELAMGYHLGCIRWFYRTWELAALNGVEEAFPTSYIDMIEKMCEVPMKLGLPDGTNAQFGDAWAGKPGQHTPFFREWAERFNRDDFLYLATGGEEGAVPENTAYALKESGLYSLRSSWDTDAICMVLKCGPDGGGHSQPDNGTFTLSAGGRTLMPDAGSYIYSGNPEGRRWFRQTSIHQTLTLDGKNTKYAPKLLKWQPGETLDILVVENAGYDSLTHRRSVFFVDKKYFVIVDEAIGTAIGDVDIHFQLAPGQAIFSQDQLSVRSDFKEGWNVMVRTNPQKGLELTEEEGWVSFVYTKKEPRPAFRYRVRKTKAEQPVRFVTLVVPYEGAVPDVRVKLESKSQSDGNSLQLTIKENGSKRRIAYEL